ncbi:MAG: hypothetical protein CMK59_08490 [Proteobacteria bacterium]|nr:hypothetical protein [Pseudomonadota bacterium]
MFLFLTLSCKPLDKLLEKAVAKAVVIAENTEFEEAESDDDNGIVTVEQEPDDFWDEEDSNPSTSFDTEAEIESEDQRPSVLEVTATFEMIRVDTGQDLCSSAAFFGVTDDGLIWGEHACTTPNGQELFFWYDGLVALNNTQGLDSVDDYMGLTGGVVTMEAPSGMLFESQFYGECFGNAEELGLNMSFEMTVQAPDGIREYVAYVYSD